MKAMNPAHSAALAAYPIGSIYMSVNAADPETLFGGTWERIQGRFLFAADDARPAGNTGGEETHTLTINEIPFHNHTPLTVHTVANWTSVSPGNMYGGLARGPSNQGDDEWKEDQTGITGVGNNQPHNNMPPYLSVYCWKRTA